MRSELISVKDIQYSIIMTVEAGERQRDGLVQDNEAMLQEQASFPPLHLEGGREGFLLLNEIK